MNGLVKGALAALLLIGFVAVVDFLLRLVPP